MKILIGTTSKQKIKIIKNVLNKKKINAELIPCEVDSGVMDQPTDEEMTIQGSINRAINSIKLNEDKKEYYFSVGLEGGLCLVNNLFHLICVVSVVDKEGLVYTGVSNKNPLPKIVSDCIKNGGQFGNVIREFEKKINSKDKDISELVVELINRTRGFTEAFEISLLKLKNKKIFK